MKRECTAFVCAGILVFASLFSARAEDAVNLNTKSSQTTNSAGKSAQAREEASNMVPAHAELLNTLDAKKWHTGEPLQARLQSTIQLKNGRELPDGAVLLGTVTADQVRPDNVKLALRFNEAKLKDGTTVPIKAMVVSIQPAESSEYAGEYPSRLPAKDIWTSQTYTVDQIGAVSGADLHSSVTSDNSAVISSNRKNDLQIDRGAEIDLAIAAQKNGSLSKSANSAM